MDLDNGCFKGKPLEISYPSEVMGQLIVCDGTDFYIVVKTRNIETYYEPSKPARDGSVKNEPHYKIGGFVKVDPRTIQKHDGKSSFISCNYVAKD